MTSDMQDSVGILKTLAPFKKSLGYQLRITSILMQRKLQRGLVEHGVSLGMWYFLRVLWEDDGLTQRELSSIVGTMEPTTLTAVKSMEKAGLVIRKRNKQDKRKINVFLTEKGQSLKPILSELAAHVINDATKGFSERELDILLDLLSCIQSNVRESLGKDEDTEQPDLA